MTRPGSVPWHDPSVATVRTARTADLRPAELAAARALVDVAFAGSFGDVDWANALGGIHALASEDGELVAHASMAPRLLRYDGRTLRTGYVEAVAVRPDRRRRGLGARVMAPLERAIRAGFDAGALSATDDGAPLYAARGWIRWSGPTSVLTAAGPVRTEDDDGSVYVLPAGVPLDPSRPLACDWREGDVW